MKRGPYNPCPRPTPTQLATIRALWTADNDETQASIAERVGLPMWRVGRICREEGWDRNRAARKRRLRKQIARTLARQGKAVPVIEPAPYADDEWVPEPPRPWPPHRFSDDPRAVVECWQGTGERRAA